MLNEDDIRLTFLTVSSHLDKGGIFIFSPDYFLESFENYKVNHFTNSNETTTLTYIEYMYIPNPNKTQIESILFYLINENGNLRIEQDKHIVGIFPKKLWIKLLLDADFSYEEYPYIDNLDFPNHKLIVATKL